jgi:hypothetical protein
MISPCAGDTSEAKLTEYVLQAPAFCSEGLQFLCISGDESMAPCFGSQLIFDVQSEFCRCSDENATYCTSRFYAPDLD